MRILDCEENESLQNSNKEINIPGGQWLSNIWILHIILLLVVAGKYLVTKELYFKLEKNGMANLVILNLGFTQYVALEFSHCEER